MKKEIIGDKSKFAMEYSFLEDNVTELAMFVEGKNILEFFKDGLLRTTRWNLDELAEWLRNLIDNLKEDPYPVDVDGEFAVDKDNNAWDYDSDDEEELDEYYEKLHDWCDVHRWHIASSGAILANAYFQLIGDKVEISWDNEDLEDNTVFTYLKGGTVVDKDLFFNVIDKFLNDYANHWFNVG